MGLGAILGIDWELPTGNVEPKFRLATHKYFRSDRSVGIVRLDRSIIPIKSVRLIRISMIL